jgi:hypothetical protein
MNNEQQELIDEVYEKYSIIAGMSTQVMTLTKGWFLRQIKFNPKFSETWGLNIEERELSLEERKELMVKYTNDNSLLPIGFSVPFGEESNKKYLEVCDSYSIPTRLITITYNDKIIESYE